MFFVQEQNNNNNNNNNNEEPVAAAIAYGLGSPRARADGAPSPRTPLAETVPPAAGGDPSRGQPPRPFDDDTVLVVDLGGGTLDVAVVDAFEGMLEVIGSSGDARLGGVSSVSLFL